CRCDADPSQLSKRLPNVRKFIDDIDIRHGSISTAVDTRRDEHLEEHGQPEVSLIRITKTLFNREQASIQRPEVINDAGVVHEHPAPVSSATEEVGDPGK